MGTDSDYLTGSSSDILTELQELQKIEDSIRDEIDGYADFHEEMNEDLDAVFLGRTHFCTTNLRIW